MATVSHTAASNKAGVTSTPKGSVGARDAVAQAGTAGTALFRRGLRKRRNAMTTPGTTIPDQLVRELNASQAKASAPRNKRRDSGNEAMELATNKRARTLFGSAAVAPLQPSAARQDRVRRYAASLEGVFLRLRAGIVADEAFDAVAHLVDAGKDVEELHSPATFSIQTWEWNE